MGLEQRINICSDNNGGIKELYVMGFTKYGRSQITYSGNTITSFPYSVIYPLDFVNGSFTEDIDDVDGGVSFKQKLAFKLIGINEDDDFKTFAAKDLRFIIKTRNNDYRLIGTHTGIKGKYTKEQGENRADFVGFSFDFDTEEEKTAGWLDNLNNFDINAVDSLNYILNTLL